MALSVTNIGIDGLESVEQIGTGGSSRVYRAHQVDLDRVVAIKVLNPGDDQGVAKRFDRERKAMGRLSLHEGIVPVYSSGVTSHGEPYLVMPYYANGSLQDQIDAGPLEWETAVSYVDVAAETIAEAHDEGIVHLDLKPANILLTNTGAPRIADFGISRLTGAVTAGITAGTAFTPAYSAPETFLDGETGPPSDVYGLGATLWALLVGHPPFLTPGEDANLMAVIGRVVNNQVGDLRSIAPEGICEVVERAMAKHPADRYQTAREFSLALKHAAAGAPKGFAPPIGTAGAGTALFPAPVTAHQPAGPAPADPTVAMAGPSRALLQETAEPLPMPSPMPMEQGPQGAPAPFVDLDRLRMGPILVGTVAFLLIVGAAAWAFSRGPDGDTAEQGNESLAGPSTDDGGTTLVAGDAGTADDAATSSPTDDATGSSSITSTTEDPSGSTTEDATTSTTEDPSSSTTEDATTSSTSSTTSTTLSTTSSSSTTSTTTVEPLQAPTALEATFSGTGVRLTWDPPASGPNPTGYVVLRNGATIRDDLVQTSFIDRNLDPGTYSYTVRAVDADGDLSPTSETETITVVPLEITEFDADREEGSPGTISVSFTTSRCVTVYRISVIAEGETTAEEIRTGPDAGCEDSGSERIPGLDPATEYQVNLVVQPGTESESDFRTIEPVPDDS